MSYDLGIWYAATPITSTEASEIYGRIGEDPAVTTDGTLQATPSIAKLVKDLTAQHPQLEDCDADEADASPWSGPFEVTDRYLSLNLAFSEAEEVVELLEELCAKHDLVLYDPQRDVVIYPPRLAKLPHRRLSTENGTVIDDPTPEDISITLAKLKAKGNCFAIFERRDEHYFQTLKESARKYIVEYRAGSADQHYHAVTSDLNAVTQAFQAFAEDRDTWRKQFTWEKLDLSADEDQE